MDHANPQNSPPNNGVSSPNLKTDAQASPSVSEETMRTLQRASETARENLRANHSEMERGRPDGRDLRIPTRPDQAELDRRETANRLADQTQLLRAALIPSLYGGSSTLDADHLPADTRRHYAKMVCELRRSTNHRPSVTALLGLRGTGKTHLACGLIRDFCLRAEPARYCEVMDFYIDLLNEPQPEVERRYAAPALLVIDAMEERPERPWHDQMLVRLINKRYANRKVTLLLSNQSAGEFQDRVGDSISDRIMDGGAILTCAWKSLRGRVRTEVAQHA